MDFAAPSVIASGQAKRPLDGTKRYNLAIWYSRLKMQISQYGTLEVPYNALHH